MRKTIIVLLAMSIMLGATGLAAATSIAPDDEYKVIPAGSCDTFTLTLTPSYTEQGKLAFATSSPLKAQIDGNPALPALVGQTPFSSYTAEVPTTHPLYVCMDAGAVDGAYEVDVFYFGQVNGQAKLRAFTQPVAATPELPISALMSVGLIGLLGMVYIKRKN